MDEKNERQEFDLDEILSEFHVDAPEEEGDVDLDALLGDLEEAPAEASEETVQEPAEEVLSDTGRMNALIDQIGEAVDAQTGDLTLGDTIRMEELKPEAPREEVSVPTDETRRLDLPAEELSAEELNGAEEQAHPAPIPLKTPRARLRELKKKLVAGPEKRYYELSGEGTVGMQVSIGLNILLVLGCILVTTLFTLNMIPESRLKLVIFSQVLAMLLSALLGANLMIDGIADLLKGRITLHFLIPITFLACCADAVYCLSELRVPCCAAFSLQITMGLLSQYHRRSAEMSQMDTMRKAVRLISLVKVPDFYKDRPGFLRSEGEVEDFMDTYDRPSGPEKVQGVYALLCLLACGAMGVMAGMLHGVSLGIQVFSTGLLVAVPASFLVSLTRPAHLLERRLHMVGTVLCGWQGIKGMCGKAVFPLRDEDVFPAGSTKLNGVKLYGERSREDVISYTASLICRTDSGLVTVFRQMLASRNGTEHPVENFRDYGTGGIGGVICGEPVLLGTLDFMQDMNVKIPEGTMVSQAIYAAIDGELCAVFAISYAKMKSSAAGLVSLCGSRKVTPVIVGEDFMLTDSLIQGKFGVNTRRIAFPQLEERQELAARKPEGGETVLCLATHEDLASYAYAVSGARALRTASVLGVIVHLIAGILGMLAVAALAFLGAEDLLTPTHVLLYQLVWLVPGLLITEWTRTV